MGSVGKIFRGRGDKQFRYTITLLSIMAEPLVAQGCTECLVGSPCCDAHAPVQLYRALRPSSPEETISVANVSMDEINLTSRLYAFNPIELEINELKEETPVMLWWCGW